MKKKLIKWLALVLVCLTAMSFVAACSSGGATDTPDARTDTRPPATTNGGDTAITPDRTLYIAVAQDSGSLHPHGITGAGGFISAILTIYETLFNLLPDGSFEMVLAEEIEEISDVNYIIHMRQGVTFSNGNPLTAHDVMFTMNYIREHPRLSAEVRPVCFERTTVLDDYRLDLWLLNYDAGAFAGFTLMYILNEASYDALALASDPVGTGPFQVVEYVVNSHLIVEARDGYWGARPAIERIHFRVLNEPSQRVNALMTGDVHYATIPIREAEFIRSLGLVVEEIMMGTSLGAFFNVSENGLLGTPAAREAIAHAINRQAVVDIAYSGIGGVPRWPTSEATVDFEARLANMHPIYSVGYDPDRARELAEQEGLIGQTVRIITNGTEEFITVAEVMQHHLQAVGINAQIHNFDQATYWAVMSDEDNFEIALQMIASPDNRGLRHMGYIRFFPLGWTHPDLEDYLSLFHQGMGTRDLSARADILYELVEIHQRHHLWYALVDLVAPHAYSSELGGVTFYLDGSLRFQNWYWHG
ncbi:MAG: ABC transporter substrate-binding protein [Oscillospiraceae bacterium]|nr:ABC transporter substrate-binding protein [Oscillospiraceae bacterium]